MIMKRATHLVENRECKRNNKPRTNESHMCACYRPNKTKLNYGSDAQVELANRSTEMPRFGKTMPAELFLRNRPVCDRSCSPPDRTATNCNSKLLGSNSRSATMLHVD